MKKIALMLLGAALVASMLAACGGSDGDKTTTTTTASHTHTYNTEWSMDENNHWYSASCEHKDEKANFASHADADKNGLCDICSYDYGHTHAYAEEWTRDENKHWHAATCNHEVRKDEASHADANNDGLCDACSYDYGHSHTYEEGWTHDTTDHWHKASCSHDIPVTDKGAHADANNDGLCDVCAYDYGHTHTYEEGWSSDDNKHWYKASCGHDVIKDEAPHKDQDMNGRCDICSAGYDHVHTYEEKWTYDDNNHWRKPDCGHDIAVVDQGAHADKNNDGLCDTCSWSDGHQHTYESTWKYDDKSHWNVASCGHNVVGNKASHTDKNKDGLCDTCKGFASLKDAINAGASDKSTGKVNGGRVEIDAIWDVEENMSSLTEVEYIFGKNYLIIKDITNESITHYTLLNGGEVFAVTEYDGALSRVEAEAANMKGYAYYANIVSGEFTSYGAEDLISCLYAFASEHANSVITEGYDCESGIYSFSFYYAQYDEYNKLYGNLYELSATFTLDDEYVMKNVNVVSNVYISGAGTDYTVDANGICTLKKGASIGMIYTVTFEQTVGTRTLESSYTPEKLVPKSFDLMDEEGNKLGSSINVVPGKMFMIYFGNLVPSNADIVFDSISVTSSDSAKLVLNYWSGNDYVYVNPKASGTYTMTVKGINCTKTVTIVVSSGELSALIPGIFEKDINGYYSQKNMLSAQIYAGQKLYFTATPNPSFISGAFTATANGATVGKETIKVDGVDMSVSYFTANKAGTYVITLTSTVKESVKCQLTVKVLEAPSAADILNGEKFVDIWGSNNSSYTLNFVFTPDSAGATSGKVTITKSDKVEVMNYTVVNGEIKLTHVSGSDLGCKLAINSDFALVVSYINDYGTYSNAILLESTNANVLQGEWASADVDPECKIDFSYNTIYLSRYSEYSYLDIALDVDGNGNITILFMDKDDITVSDARYNGQSKTVTLKVTFKGQTYEYTLSKMN